MTALDDLVEALQDARSSVFRLEARQDYLDDELWQAYQRGEWWEQSDDLTGWCSLVSAAVDRGVTWIRARVVTEPWTPYTQWEIEQHYPHNVRAGESVRLCGDTSWSWPDFWLVDNERGWVLEYAPGGAMTVEEATSRVLPVLRAWRDLALSRSEPLAPAPA